MNNFWNRIKKNKRRDKIYFTVDKKSEIFSSQDIQEYIEKLKEEKIDSFGLSSVPPNFLQSKESDLSLSRILLTHKEQNTPFYFRVSLYQVVEPKNFRLLLIFISNKEVKRYVCTEATAENFELFWMHLINGSELLEYNFSKWFDESEWYEEYLQIRRQQEEKELQYPPLLTDLFWNFQGNKFQDKRTFVEAVDNYHKEFNKKWNSNENVEAPSELIIFYPYKKDGREKTGRMTLKNLQPWTKADLLLAIHNKCATKIQYQDNHFMEGLTYHNHNKANVATYFLNLGS